MAQVRWGVLGCGKIGNDFAQALKNVPGAKIVSVGSRSKESAVNFGKSLNIPEEKCYGSYEELVKDNEIDVIYVATPHGHHYQHCLLCFQNNKNVFCEKAITLSAPQLKVLIAAAKEKNLFFMEAFWTRFQPAIEFLQKEILPKIQPIHYVNVDFGFQNQGTPRLTEPALGGGALLDIGVYCVNLISIAFAEAKPTQIHATANLDDNKIDHETNVQFKFKNGSANMFCTIEAATPSECLIVGSNGYVKIHAPFWCTTRLSVKFPSDTKEVVHDFPLADDGRVFNFTNSALMQYEIAHATKMIQEGKKESDVFPLSHSLQIMEILDDIRNQAGISYGDYEKI